MSLRSRWTEWRTSREEQRNVAQEMQFHIEQEIQHNIRNGMTPADARRKALLAFGGADRFAEAARDERTGTKLSDFMMSYLDWKLGIRMLRRYPALSIIGGITLAAAIGLGAAFMEATMLFTFPDVPLPEGDRIVRIDNYDAEAMDVDRHTLHDFFIWRDQVTTIEQLGAARSIIRNFITADSVSEPVMVAEITANAFPLTRVEPLMGRVIGPADERADAQDVVVISHALWQKRFGGDHRVLGTEVQVGRTRATIIGVMPENYTFPETHHIWAPFRHTQAAPREGAPITVFGRLRDDVTLRQAQAEVGAISARIVAASPDTHRHIQARVVGLAASESPDATLGSLLPNGLMWLLLAAACANVATLMFARTAMRESEIVVRSALGASRLRVMAQLYAEALVLTAIAGAVGLIVAAFAMRYLGTIYAEPFRHPFWYEFGIEPETILYTVVLVVVGAALVALLPALRATGSHVSAALRRVGAGGTSMRFGGVWSVVIVLQVAFSVLCLPFAISISLDARARHAARAAFPATSYLTFDPELDPSTLQSTADEDYFAARAAAVGALVQRLEREPGVASATATEALPGMGYPAWRIETQSGGVAPTPIASNIEGNYVQVAHVSADFFETFDLQPISGRTLREADVRTDAPVAVVNESMARNLGGRAVGMQVRTMARDTTQPGRWIEIVGVVRDMGLERTKTGEKDLMFVGAANAGEFVAVRVQGDAANFAPSLSRIAASVDPDLRLFEVQSLRERIDHNDLPILQLTLAGIAIVLLSIVLSAASLYALMSVAVARRTREIGIRVAIGASRQYILRSLFGRAAAQVGIGIIAGNVLLLVLLPKIVSEVSYDLVITPMVAASVCMALVGFGACFVPGRRALAIQPTEAFRETR